MARGRWLLHSSLVTKRTRVAHVMRWHADANKTALATVVDDKGKNIYHNKAGSRPVKVAIFTAENGSSVAQSHGSSAAAAVLVVVDESCWHDEEVKYHVFRCDV